MACNCKNTSNPIVAKEMADTTLGKVVEENRIAPTEQCIACAQKHFDEAWIAFNECGYESANRRFIRGSLRAIVLHTYKHWEDIGRLARECALLIQEAKDKEAVPKMKRLGEMIDEAFYEANPEVKNRLEKLYDDSDSDSVR